MRKEPFKNYSYPIAGSRSYKYILFTSTFLGLLFNSHSQNIAVLSVMHPKVLRVTVIKSEKKTMWINDTYYIEKAVLRYRDRLKLDAIAGALGFSYEVKFPLEAEGYEACLPNDTCNGKFGMLQRQEVDIVIGDFAIEEEPYEKFRFSYESTFMKALL